MAKGRIVVNVEVCKGCELCTTICPYNLIQMAEFFNSKSYRPARLVDPEQRCTGCTLCAMICPDAAIIVFREVKVKAQDTRSAAIPGMCRCSSALRKGEETKAPRSEAA